MKLQLQAAATVVALLSASGCSAPGGEEKVSRVAPVDQSSSLQQEPLIVETDDPMGESSLLEYIEASKLVLRGTIVRTDEDGPKFAGLPPYTLVTVRPTAVLKGEAPSGDITVLMLTRTESGRPIQIEGRPDFTAHESVWMLTPVDPMFSRPAGEYVLTGNAGLLPGDPRGAIDIVVSEVTPAIVDAENIGTLDEIEEVVVSSGRGSSR